MPVDRAVRDGRWRRQCGALLGVMLLPILAAYAIMARYQVNIPFIDDYPVILRFVVQYEGLPTAGARMHYILADQYLEYKLVLIHTVSALQLAVAHHVSFSFLFWVGDLLLIPLLYLMWKSYLTGEVDLRRRLILFLPIVFLLFSVNYGEALDYTETAIGYIGTITVSLWSIYLVSATGTRWEGWRRTAGCLCALTACLLGANAFLLLPMGLFLLLPRRAYGWAGAWSAMFIVAILPYFVSFSRAASRSGHGSIWLIPAFFFSFLGAALQFAPIAGPVGLGILAVYAVALRTGFWRTHPVAMLGVTWLLISAALAAVGRGRTGLSFSTVSRYRIYSDIFLIFCYGYLVHRVEGAAVGAVNKRRLYVCALAASVLLCVHGEYQAANILRNRRAMLVAGAAYYRAEPRTHSPMHFDDKDADKFFTTEEIDARNYVEAAEREGLYRLPVEAGR